MIGSSLTIRSAITVKLLSMKLSLRLLRGTARRRSDSILTAFAARPSALNDRSLVGSALQTVVLDVEGMKCGGCVRSVERTLLEQPGVERVDVNLVSRAAWLDLSPAEGSVERLLKALSDRGFPAKERSLEEQVARSRASHAAGPGWWRQWRQLMVALVLLLFSVLGHLAEAGQL